MTIAPGRVEPTGEERLVRPDELFFSTTDSRGIIRAGNSVFARISAYPVKELVGAPHNIIRHPDMPGGAFKVMWDRLLDKQPMVAYVENLAKDGRTYWVFATVTPLHGGFLSVRMAPMTALYPAARQLYNDLRDVERRARESGLSRADFAAEGAIALERAIRQLGFGDYGHFMAEALPAEVAARQGMMTVHFAGQPGHGPVGEIVTASAALDRQLATLVSRLDAYRELSEQLSRSSWSMLDAARGLQRAVESALNGSARVRDSVAQAMGKPCDQTADTLRTVVSELDSLRGMIGGLRFRIALARLHNDMVASFASEVIAGGAPDVSLPEVPLLCDAMHEGVEHMAVTMDQVNAGLAAVAEEVARAGAEFNEFRRFIGKWRLLVMRHHATAGLGGYVDSIDQMLDAGHGQLQQLHELARRCRAEIFPFESAGLAARLAQVQRAASVL